jgi:hypothetical protein
MEPDDLLCSRNAWEEKGSLVVLLLAERARSECARSTRAVEGDLGHSPLYVYGWGEGKRKPAWRFPVLAQRAVADSPRWTRARWEPARPPYQQRVE